MALPGKPANKPGSQNITEGGRPNSLGLGQRELGELLDRLEEPDQHGSDPKRDFVRWPFRQTSVKVQILHAGGTPASITVACRNISRTGMSILHSSYLHTGTKCRVLLPLPGKDDISMDGWITRCTHRSGVVHEIGIRFDRHLDVQLFLNPSPFTDWFSLERVKPEDLTGNIVCVDDSEIDRRIVKHFLRDTKLTCTMASSGAEALVAIDDSVDLALLDFHLGDMTGAELARKLRESGLKTPLIIVTCDTDAATPQTLESGDSSAFLAKPISQELLLRAIAEFLVVRKSDRNRNAANVSNAATPALAEEMLSALGQYAKRLEACVESRDATTARTLCLQVAGTAGAVGFKDVNTLATKASEALTRSKSTTESISPLRALIAMCQKVSARSSGRPVANEKAKIAGPAKPGA